MPQLIVPTHCMLGVYARCGRVVPGAACICQSPFVRGGYWLSATACREAPVGFIDSRSVRRAHCFYNESVQSRLVTKTRERLGTPEPGSSGMPEPF